MWVASRPTTWPWPALQPRLLRPGNRHVSCHAGRVASGDRRVAHRRRAANGRGACRRVVGRPGREALDPIAADFRALVSTFHRYDINVRRAIAALSAAGEGPPVGPIARRFVDQIERIATSAGIFCTQDNEVPEQASFVVPNLGITIVPLVYGDQHSWNLAYLAGEARDVPRHRHAQGVEIHLGLGHVQGYTLLGDQPTEVSEGYAMAIPASTPHGFVNTSGHEHFLPFVFGSRQLSGWGVFLNVEAQPIELEVLKFVPRSEGCLNGLVYLDREIERAERLSGNAGAGRWSNPRPRFAPTRAALVLSMAQDRAWPFVAGRIRSASFRSCRRPGIARVGPVEQAVSAHDHFGIPAGLTASLKPVGREPLVTLDAILVSKLGRVV